MNKLIDGITVDGRGPVLVLLHSSLSSARQWHGLASKLATQFTVINVDLLGYGDAGQVVNEECYSFDTEVERILSTAQLINSECKFHLVGHSCGGAIALKMAIEMPKRVLSLCLYEPVAFHLFDIESKERQQVVAFAKQVHQQSDELATKAFVDYWNGQGYFDSLPIKVQQQMSSGIKKVILDFKGIFIERYCLEQLTRLNMPSLLLFGKYSPELSQLLSQKIIASLPDVEFRQVAAGHMAPISHPHLVEPLLIDFLCR